jgi:tetratricopeptide (TPR) repeat protein
MTAFRSTPRRIASTLVLSVLAGCASTGPAPSTPDEKLDALAGRELSDPAPPVAAPVPPGVGEDVLATRDPGDEAAWLALDVVLRRLPPPPEPAGEEPAPAAEPLDDDLRDQALRSYARGRDAALRGENFAAIIELEKAQAIDPQSAEIVRQLARCYLAMRNNLKAARHYERLLQIEPGDSESLFMLGLATRTRREFEPAASYLAQPRLAGTTFTHDAIADVLATYWLADALRELGYDRAWIELARDVIVRLEPLTRPTFYVHHYEALYRQRGELWREIGDAHCRLGEHAEALEAYRAAAGLPSAEPELLVPRIIYTDLHLGRVHGAQAQLLQALTRSDSINERDLRLCEYVAEHTAPLDLMAAATVARYRERPDDAGLARAAAVLLPGDEAVALLREFLDRRPDDLEVFTQLLEWLAARDERSAVELTVALVEARPGLASAYGDCLARVGRGTGSLLEHVPLLPPSPALAVVHCRLLAYVGGVGRAWYVCAEALDRWPDDRALRIQQIYLAGRLEEPRLLDEAIEGSAHLDDASTWLARARVERVLGRYDEAIRAASEAARVQPASPDVLVELVHGHVALAERSTDAEERRQHVDDALVAAREAVRLDPYNDEAYAALLAVYMPGGLAADQNLHREVRLQIERTAPKSRLLAKLQAQDDLRRGRMDRGIQRLLALSESDPTDALSLELAVASLVQAGREQEALERVEAQLDARPGDPMLLERWVTLMLRQERASEAIERLQGVIAAAPAHDAARGMLETVYRRAGSQDEALPLGEERLLSRPQGMRRELELAAMYAGAGRDDEALAYLGWVLDRADEATFEHLVSALGVIGRMSDRDARHDPMALEFAELTVQRYPEAPLQIYGSALRALARLDRVDQHFDDLADRAVRFGKGASGASYQAADVWRQLAQALVSSDEPLAAGRAVRARLWADAPLDPAARALLARVALVADAAADRPDASIALIDRLALRGWLPPTPGVDAEPTLPEVLYETSIVYAMLGREDGAERLLRQAVEVDPAHAMALNNLGYTRLEMGFADEQTVDWIEQAHAARPDDANVLDSIGWLRYKQGRFEGEEGTPGAVELIRGSLARGDEPVPEVYDHLGDALWRLGDVEAARRAWEQAVEILQDEERRERYRQIYIFVQTRQWGLVVADPAEIHERQFGRLLEDAREKLRVAEEGGAPAVAATFEELAQEAQSSGDVNDGRP